MTGRRIFFFVSGVGLVLVAVLAGLLAWEMTTFHFEARYLSRYAAKMQFWLGPGQSRSIRFPHAGPFDERMGYSELPAFIQRLQAAGFVIDKQARISPAMRQMDDLGFNLPWHEKTRSGLTLLDENQQVIYSNLEPHHGFASYPEVPAELRNSLVFIENHELLDQYPRQRNPAVEWFRLAQAVLNKAEQEIMPGHDVPGGSTLATQIEKYRHSPDGLTLTVHDKWQQMASASVRAYLDGMDTHVVRQQLVLDYLNTVPLSARPGYGEVLGLPDGMQAWFGLDYRELARRLAIGDTDAQTGYLFKHALSLMIAQRKPSYFLISDRAALSDMTDFYLRLLAKNGVISSALRDSALAAPLTFTRQSAMRQPDFVDLKAASALRGRLAGLLKINRLYQLDRLDLIAQTTLNDVAQRQATDFLTSLNNPDKAQQLGLYGHNLFTPGVDLSHVMFSFTLYERTSQGAALRVQADNLNQPFDINQGAKLDLGSTAKLRTLITYLEIVSSLHDQFAAMSPAQLASVTHTDPIADWAIDWYRTAQDRSLASMLDAAMARQYSGNTSETFFTAGGLHHFVNFDKAEDKRVMDLWEATRDSVNLVYIRLMRDITRYYIAHRPGMTGNILADEHNPARRQYLEQFADREGKAYLLRFYREYRGMTPTQIDAALLESVRPSARRLAALYRYLAPQASETQFATFLHIRAENQLDERQIAQLYAAFAPGRWSLTDLGYILQLHPLKLWLGGFLRNHPGANFAQAVAASHDERIQVYAWLYRNGRKNAQDIRIHSLLEVEAFEQIHQDWKRLGYPFSSLVPSYATALGVSADRPAALAHLMGILVNDGVSLPEMTLTALNFAKGTPFETDMAARYQPGERLLPVELTRVVRKALQGVVQSGTAVRLHDAFRDQQGTPLAVGGKTGTGDHRFDTFDNNGNVLTSKPVSRSATLVFFVGDRFFGTMTAVVTGEIAGNYHFTSAVIAQLMKDMSPWLLKPFHVMAAEVGKGIPVSTDDKPGGAVEGDVTQLPADNSPARDVAPDNQNVLQEPVGTGK